MGSSPKKKQNKSSEKKDKKRKEKRKRDDDSTTATSSSKKTNNSMKQALQSTHVIDDIGSENSPFQEKQVRVLVSIPPSTLVNIPSALNAYMQHLLLKYSDTLGGVLISYHDIELDDASDQHGRIINEMPHIHYYIKCNVLVFNPSVGAVLRGKVNESFPSHVGLLVHELFNAMISAKLLRQNGFQFDDESHQWSKIDNGADRVIEINDGMEFTVDRLHECNGMISLDCKNPVFLNNEC